MELDKFKYNSTINWTKNYLPLYFIKILYLLVIVFFILSVYLSTIINKEETIKFDSEILIDTINIIPVFSGVDGITRKKTLKNIHTY